MTEQQNKIIEQLYLSLYVKMLIYAKATLRDEALAEEAVQEAFRIACVRPEVLCESPAGAAHVFGIEGKRAKALRAGPEG